MIQTLNTSNGSVRGLVSVLVLFLTSTDPSHVSWILLELEGWHNAQTDHRFSIPAGRVPTDHSSGTRPIQHYCRSASATSGRLVWRDRVFGQCFSQRNEARRALHPETG